jgi:hypothetical protein
LTSAALCLMIPTWQKNKFLLARGKMIFPLMRR